MSAALPVYLSVPLQSAFGCAGNVACGNTGCVAAIARIQKFRVLLRVFSVPLAIGGTPVQQFRRNPRFAGTAPGLPVSQLIIG